MVTLTAWRPACGSCNHLTLMSILLNRWKASASPSLFLALLSFHPSLCHQGTVLKCKCSALLS